MCLTTLNFGQKKGRVMLNTSAKLDYLTYFRLYV